MKRTLILALGLPVAAMAAGLGAQSSGEFQVVVEEGEQLTVVAQNGKRRVCAKLKERCSGIQANGHDIYAALETHVLVMSDRGKTRQRINIPLEARSAVFFSVLPDGALAFFNNYKDAMYLVSADGDLLRAVTLGKEDGSQQSYGCAYTKDSMVVAGAPGERLIEVDLGTFEVRQLDPEPGGGQVAIRGTTIYHGSGAKLQAWRLGVDGPVQVAELPKSNITGLAITGRHAVVVVNGVSALPVDAKGPQKLESTTGELYLVDLESGKVEVLATGLQWPGGLTLLPGG